MRARAVLLLGAGIALLASAEAAEKRSESKDVLPMRVVQALTCKNVRDGGELLEAVDAGERFSTSDRQVSAFVKFQHVFKAHKIQWKWYDPEDKLYTQSSELAVKLSGKYHEFFTGSHAILVQGER